MSSLVEDQGLVLKDCTDRLERLGVGYMLTGSVAMLQYAVGRMTNDIDIVVEIDGGSESKIVAEFEEAYYVPIELVRHAVKRRSMFNLIHNDTVIKVDLVLLKETDFQKVAFRRRRRLRFSDYDIWTISKEDLILSKLDWARDSESEMQLRDVSNLLRTKVDEEYVNSWAEKLAVTDLLNRCRLAIKSSK